jgi:hypothetical protein
VFVGKGNTMLYDHARFCRRLQLLAIVVITSLGSAAQAAPTVDGVVDASYGAPLASDPVGDYVGLPQWDLSKLWVTHDTTHLYIAFSIAGDISANPADEKNYLFYIDTTGDAAGATSDAWKRKITAKSPHRPEYSINTWYKGGSYGGANVELRRWTGSAWDPTASPIAGAAMKVSGGVTTIEWKVARVDLGSPNDLYVEVISTGSFVTDNAQDTINTPADDWNAPSGATQWTTPATVTCSTHYPLVLPADAGVPDVGSPDLGTPDTGIPDSGAPDSAQPDLGSPDQGVSDSAAADASKPKPDSWPADSAVAADKGPSASDAGVDTTSRPDSGADPLPDAEGCGCAAKGDLTAANALPLLIACAVLGLHRRRRRHDLDL